MKRLLATTAIALLASAPLYAQDQPAPADGAMAPAAPAGSLFVTSDPTDLMGSDLLGMPVYSAAAPVEPGQTVTAEARSQWDNIGSINDLLLSAEGDVRAVLVDVGGFLGMGAHTVALAMDEVRVLVDDADNRFAAVTSSREALEAAPAFEPLAEPETTAVDAPPAATGTVPADTMAADDTAPAAPGMMAADPAAPTYVPLAAEELTADRLDGAAIYTRQDESVGSISELVLAPDGTITEAIVDVGGFLGMGAHRVALAFEELDVMTDPQSGDVRVYIDADKQDLEQRPPYQAN